MGMDVYGKNPKSENGEYFRRSVWGWRPLAEFIRAMVDEEITSQCAYWHTNDGAGLDEEHAIRLADALDALVADGTAEKYIAEREAYLAALPRQKCKICGGTGVRDDAIGIESGWPEKIVEGPPDNPRLGQKGSCNACHGWGSQEHFDKHYGLDTDDIEDFAAFARDSGGFEIC